MLFMSLFVYGTLAIFMPHTYTNKLNIVLDVQTQSFISELEQVTIQNSGGLFDRFLQTDNVQNIELYNDNGQQIALPTNSKSEIEAGAASETVEEIAPTLSNNYYFSFMGVNTSYMMIVYGSAAQVAELQQSFIQVLPFLLLIVLIVAFLTAWLYSHLITAPVLKISKISKEMSDLKLNWKIKETRSDELGILEKSLNTLSQKLVSTLSDLQSANEQLKKDIEHERELEQAQMDFFSAASHELKTPITVIKGQLEGMILGIGTYKDHEKYLFRSLEVANTLENMVQELLTISRLHTPTANSKLEQIDCVPIIQNFLRETEDLIVNKELQIIPEMPVSVVITGNRLLLEKVYSNLIGNAIKYSPQGATINISIQKQQEKYQFSIENSGTHIPKDTLSKIFEAFYRIEHSRNRKTGGSGLGLYIVQKILQQHGSFCSVCNTEKGVLFAFEL